MPFLPTSSALAIIPTPSTVSIEKVRILHRRIETASIFCYVGVCVAIFRCLIQDKTDKYAINIDCDPIHIITNKLEYFKVDWSVYVDGCDNIRTYYNKISVYIDDCENIRIYYNNQIGIWLTSYG